MTSREEQQRLEDEEEELQRYGQRIEALQKSKADLPGLSLAGEQSDSNPLVGVRNQAAIRAVLRSRSSTRPLSPDDATYTERFGAELRRLRLAAEVGQSELARLSGISRSHLQLLEGGGRRTRRSTIEKLADWLVPCEEWPPGPDGGMGDGPSDEQYDAVVERLVELLGPCLAAEKQWPKEPVIRVSDDAADEGAGQSTERVPMPGKQRVDDA